MHAHCLNWLMSTGLLFHSYVIGNGDLILLPLSVDICSRSWPIVGTGGHCSHSSQSFVVLHASLFWLMLPPTHPHLTYPYVYTLYGPISMCSMKIIMQKLAKAAIIYLPG